MLQHVTLEVPPDKVRDCVAFWEMLGFEELEVPEPLRGRFTWVGRQGTHIHLMPRDTPGVPEQGHAAIVAEDAERVVATLREHGFDPQPGEVAWPAPRWFVRDPVGHRVEVMAGAPPSNTLGR